jgi:hypothetical protein
MVTYPLVQCLNLEEPFVFPSLRETCSTLLRDILDKTLPGWNERSYSQDIQIRGGIGVVTDDLLSYIRPEILQLQGRLIRTETLEEVRKVQGKDQSWDGDTGYMNFITDTMDRGYNRRYVGQTTDAERRIIREHCQKIVE